MSSRELFSRRYLAGSFSRCSFGKATAYLALADWVERVLCIFATCTNLDLSRVRPLKLIRCCEERLLLVDSKVLGQVGPPM